MLSSLQDLPRRTARPGSLSLAQVQHLVTRPPESLKRSEWGQIIKRYNDRGPVAVDCCICCEPFCKPGQQILTSCAHTFHRQCLGSWEKFSRSSSRCCPVCRTQNYQKISIKHGHVAHKERCAILIQSHWRRFSAMQRFCSMWANAPCPSDGALHQKWLHNRLSHKSDNFITAMKDDGVGDLDVFFRLLDQDVQTARQVYQAADKHIVLSQPVLPSNIVHVPMHDSEDLVPQRLKDGGFMSVDWDQVTQRMRTRATEDCPICMLPLHKKRNAAGCSLLSCSHTFHAKCIESFEEFELARGGNPTCPICRNTYMRKDLVSV